MELRDMLEVESELRKISQHITQGWKCHVGKKFSRTEVLVMYTLHIDGRQRASELAEKLSITTGGLTGITDRLVNSGYIERQRDTKDRRVVHLSIAEAGMNELYKMQEARESFVQNVFKNFSPEELLQLKQVISKLLDNLDNLGTAYVNNCKQSNRTS